MRFSPDPVIQWCVEEALEARVEHEEARAVRRQQEHAHAHAQAQAMLQKAVS